MIMRDLLTALTFLFTAPSANTGAPHVVCPSPKVKAVEGSRVILPCHLDPPDDVANYAVDWKRVDLNQIVHSYRHRQDYYEPQLKQYRGRTALNHDDLSRGSLTLKIYSVNLSDSGPYRCYVSKLMTSCNTSLVVTRRGDSSTTTPPLNELDSQDGLASSSPGSPLSSRVQFYSSVSLSLWFWFG